MNTESSNSIMNWLKSAGLNLLGGIAVLVIGFLLVHWVGKILKHNKKFHAIEPTLRGFLQNLVKITLSAIVVLTAVNIIGIPMTSVLTLLASGGVAIGLALQGAVGNLLGGLILLILRPLRAGEYVKSGDSENLEGRAAAYYWKSVFPEMERFVRDREGDAPNNLLNYGYAIVRAVVARALVASGLLPTFGIHHHNRYNAFCLADDIMEPYRPYVDELVIEILRSGADCSELTTDLKRQLLGLPVKEVVIGGQRSPLMVAVTQTTASLVICFSGELRKIVYPEMP